MLKRARIMIPVAAALVAAGLTSHAAVEPKAAPAFTLKDSQGKEHSLSDFKGKVVVLEWVNYDCPFVKRHYSTGNIPGLQAAYAEKGVVWLSICSSAPGTQGHFAGDALTARIEQEKSKATAYLIDADGTVGKAYGAKTTPQIVVINAEGNLVYNGGIDSNPRTTEGATQYTVQVLDAILAGQAAPISESKPYGCSVKYK